MSKIRKIAMTGGPGAGKSTGLARIVAACQEMGFTPLIARESARDLIEAGLDRNHPHFQYFVLSRTTDTERLLEKVAETGHYPNPVIIGDRGQADGLAYVGEQQFGKTLKHTGLSMVDVRDHYDGVLFLDSAAVGAERNYDRANRSESIEEARRLNQLTLEAWHGTPHLIHIPNRPGASFADKMNECVRGLARILGVPEPMECERKFRLLDFRLESLPASAVAIDIVQTYLMPERSGVTERVRARGQHDVWLYFHTAKENVGDGQSIEHEHLVNEREYYELLERRYPDQQPIRKTRHCFMYAGHYHEVDVFSGHKQGLVLLEIELHSMDEPFEVAPFLGPYQEETGNSAFNNSTLAGVS